MIDISWKLQRNDTINSNRITYYFEAPIHLDRTFRSRDTRSRRRRVWKNRAASLTTKGYHGFFPSGIYLYASRSSGDRSTVFLRRTP